MNAPAAKPTAVTQPYLQAATAVKAAPKTTTRRSILGIAVAKKRLAAGEVGGGSAGCRSAGDGGLVIFRSCLATRRLPNGSSAQIRPRRRRSHLRGTAN